MDNYKMCHESYEWRTKIIFVLSFLKIQIRILNFDFFFHFITKLFQYIKA